MPRNPPKNPPKREKNTKSQNTRFLGSFGEETAVKILKHLGYKIICRNFVSRFGEIDIVAEDGDTLIFVEVKTRRSQKFGFAEEAVTRRKLDKIARTGEFFRLTHQARHNKMRIDVLALNFTGNILSSWKIIKVF